MPIEFVTEIRDAIRAPQPMSTTSPFAPDALETNRSGRLTGAQRKMLRGTSRGYRVGELQLAAGLTVIGLVIWFAPGPAKYATTKPLIGVACIILAAFLVARSFIGADALTHDLRSGRVDSAEGAITKWIVRTRQTGMHIIKVDKHELECSASEYAAAPEAGIVRIYFLRNSHRLVNLERLPDRPLSADAMTDPVRAINDALFGARSHDQTRSAEARAQLAAMGNALKSQVEGSVAGPPEAARDPRPLAEAILGSWSNPIVSLNFAADGSLRITTLGGRSRDGRWSVDGSGKLVSDAAGRSEPAEAWVAGRELTISMGGEAMKFEKASP